METQTDVSVESGETMKAAGLMAIETVMETSCCLIQSASPKHPELIATILSRVQGYMSAQQYVLCEYNVPLTALDACVAITPGKRAPTVQTLLGDGGEEWRAVSAMVLKKESAAVMDRLSAAYVSPHPRHHQCRRRQHVW